MSGRELFERFRTEGWRLVEQWLGDHESETNHHEFKNKKDPSTSALDEEDKANVAKALSAFANTGGGVLVFGVDAGGGGKKGQTFDRVNAIRPIEQVEAFGGSLERRLRTFTEPPIRGLDIAYATKPSTSGAGVLCIYVPKSTGGPHRAICATSEVNDRYYMRTAAGDQTMPHALLAALFAYALPPKLEFRARFLARDFLNSELGPLVELRLANRGRSPARRPAVHLFGPPPLIWPRAPETFGIQTRTTEEGLRYAALEPLPDAADLVIYPESDIVLATMRCDRPAFSPQGIRIDFHVRVMSLDSYTFEGKETLEVPAGAGLEMANERRAVVRSDVEAE